MYIQGSTANRIIVLLILVSAIAPSDSLTDICPENWIRFLYNCYYILDPRVHSQASVGCSKADGDAQVAEFRKELESKFIANLLTKQNRAKAYVRISFNSGKNRYVWSTLEDPSVNFGRWTTDNEKAPTNNAAGDCVALTPNNQWEVTDCNTALPVICQIKIKGGLECGLGGKEFDLQPTKRPTL